MDAFGSVCLSLLFIKCRTKIDWYWKRVNVQSRECNRSQEIKFNRSVSLTKIIIRQILKYVKIILNTFWWMYFSPKAWILLQWRILAAFWRSPSSPPAAQHHQQHWRSQYTCAVCKGGLWLGRSRREHSHSNPVLVRCRVLGVL